VCSGICTVNGPYYVDYDPQFPAGDEQDRGAGCYIPYNNGSEVNWKYYEVGKDQLPGCCGIKGQIDKDPEEPEPPDDGCDKIINPACDYNSVDCGKCTDGFCDDNPQCSEYDYFDTNEGISVAEENCRWNPQGTLTPCGATPKWCSPLSNPGTHVNEYDQCIGYVNGSIGPVNQFNFTVFETGDPASDTPGAYVAPLWFGGDRSWLDPMVVATHGLFYARGSMVENTPGSLNSSYDNNTQGTGIFGTKGVLTIGKSKLRPGADFDDKLAACQSEECRYALLDSCEDAETLQDHDDYAMVVASSPQRIGFEVTDPSMCDCLYDEIKDTPMEWNLSAKYYKEESEQRRPVIQKGYRYNGTDVAGFKYDSGARRVYDAGIDDDENKIILDQNTNHYWEADEKWPITMTKGDIPDGESCVSNNQCVDCARLQTYSRFNINSTQIGYTTPDWFTNVDPNIGSDVTRPDGILRSSSTNGYTDYLYGHFYSGMVEGVYLGFCRGYEQRLKDLSIGSPFVTSENGGIVFNDPSKYVPFTCHGSSWNVGFTNQNGDRADLGWDRPNFSWNFSAQAIEGKCSGLDCVNLGQGEFSIECSVYAFDTSILPLSPFTGLPELTCTGCGSELLPLGYGQGVRGFNPVKPRSAAFSNYVSNTYFKDNYSENSTLQPDKIFDGFYLAKKVVDGECVSMLCPTTPGVDNYCAALRDCKK